MEKTCFNCGTPITKEYCEDWPNVCEHWTKKKPMTNADHIRAMSDEELAEVIATFVCISHCVGFCSCSECFLEKICGEDIGVVEVLDFLKQPVKDGKNE